LRVDITALKTAEKALRESEARLQHAQRIARMGNWVSELEPISGKTEHANFMELVHPDDRGRVREARRMALERCMPSYQVEHRIVQPDGTIQALRAEAPTVPIIAISGGSKPQLYLRAATNLGATTSLEKPFSAAKLISLVKELLETHVGGA
jgi:PAS domain-containing protein